VPPRLRPLLAVAGLILAIAGSLDAQQRAREAARSPSTLPPVSMTCVHHPDVIETRPGTCPFCRMALVPIRLDTAWMCPVHSVIQEDKAGACRLCQRPLVRVTVSLTWACRNEADAVEPGACADGTPRMARRALRPHGNHNPQHGGQFFMAPDNWHHLEGTYPRDRVFRLYIYDDYSRGLAASRLQEIAARVVTRETFDPKTKRTTEQRAFRLTPSKDGAYLEARIDATTLPSEMTAKVRLSKDAPEYRFDFTFTGLTRDPNAPAPLAPTRVNPIAPTTASPVAPTTAGAIARTDSALAELPPATTVAERLAQLKIRSSQIDVLIKRGDFGAVWVPAFAAKDLAVELEAERAEPALQDLVRAAWRLDAVGDAGNRQEIEQAFAVFNAALARTLEAFGR
jgi:hypothetical protein